MTATLPALTPGVWAVDQGNSTLAFSVRHLVVSKVRGTFSRFSGRIVVAEDGSTTVEATIDVDSVATQNEKRDNHLRTADFFDTEHFPTATFVTTGYRATTGKLVTTGDFTIRGVTKRIELEVEFLGAGPGLHGPVAGFEVTGVLDRKDYGLTFNLPLEGGGVVLGDRIEITLQIEAHAENSAH